MGCKMRTAVADIQWLIYVEVRIQRMGGLKESWRVKHCDSIGLGKSGWKIVVPSAASSMGGMDRYPIKMISNYQESV
jgi:hypothetical protein